MENLNLKLKGHSRTSGTQLLLLRDVIMLWDSSEVDFQNNALLGPH